MRVGIGGSGLMGAKLGTLFARACHDVAFSYARSVHKLQQLAREAQGSARHGTVAEATRDAEDAGPLRIARYLEPFALLIGQLAYEGDKGPELTYRFERSEAKS